MLKKIAIASLCLTVISVFVFGKAYTQMRQQADVRYQNEQVIESTLGKLDQVVSGQIDITELSKQSEIAAAHKNIDTKMPDDNKSSTVAAVSAISASVFAAIFVIWPLNIVFKLISRLFNKLFAWIKSPRDEHELAVATVVPVEICVKELKETPKITNVEIPHLEVGEEFAVAQDTAEISYNPLAEMLMSSGSFLHHPKEASKLAMLYTDEVPEDQESEFSIITETATATATIDKPQKLGYSRLSKSAQEETSDISTQSVSKHIFGNMILEPDATQQACADKTEPKSLWSKTEHLEKQVSEFKEMAQSVQQNTNDSNAPVKQALDQLMHQVTAIREYASNQQDRVKKLQDGYDWTIIRSFCLRVIRCLDNIETRIEKLQEEGLETASLEETRDDFVFALESSGVEQFEPELNSEYRGQERYIEAIKDRVSCEDPVQSGRIAKVVRKGYQYVIDDDNLKVVRTAQVKLFGNQ